MRTALALGWDGAFLTPTTTDPFNEKALRAAKGATFKLPFTQGTYELFALGALPFFAADAKGKNVQLCSFPDTLILALGNETHGLSEPVKEKAERIAIPLQPSMESLNVASAGAILMYLLGAR